jgi:hypothetical protein
MKRGSNRTQSAAAAIVLSACALSGCSNPPGYRSLNMGDDLGPYVPLDSIQVTPVPYAGYEIPARSEPTLLDIDRSNWSATTMYVPISGVEHQPHYTGLYPHLATETHHQRGEFPTDINCLETTTDHSTQRQFGEVLEAPFFAAADIIMFIPRTFCAPILSVVESPTDGYQRAPATAPMLSATPSGHARQPASVPLGVPEIPHQPAPDESREKP